MGDLTPFDVLGCTACMDLCEFLFRVFLLESFHQLSFHAFVLVECNRYYRESNTFVLQLMHKQLEHVLQPVELVLISQHVNHHLNERTSDLMMLVILLPIDHDDSRGRWQRKIEISINTNENWYEQKFYCTFFLSFIEPRPRTAILHIVSSCNRFIEFPFGPSNFPTKLNYLISKKENCVREITCFQ